MQEIPAINKHLIHTTSLPMIGKTPKEISSLAKKQVRTYGSVSLLDAVVTAANNAQNVFKIQIKSGKNILQQGNLSSLRALRILYLIYQDLHNVLE
jgi:hypothetical protein